eukprot:TRINITY_DN2337_c0_g1_i1.p1 TRINITY_DN2337_c0_g1~~TRINITY_DN2337_c0_g1_i1.p1  ORF type:complete len:152 (-),score=28.07 TRINITY_DN2337_c0_g1_i1:564-1019(-)
MQPIFDISVDDTLSESRTKQKWVYYLFSILLSTKVPSSHPVNLATNLIASNKSKQPGDPRVFCSPKDKWNNQQNQQTDERQNRKYSKESPEFNELTSQIQMHSDDTGTGMEDHLRKIINESSPGVNCKSQDFKSDDLYWRQFRPEGTGQLF